MPKQRRAAGTRSPAKKSTSSRPSRPAKAVVRGRAAAKPASRTAVRAAVKSVPRKDVVPEPPPPPRKPAFYEALALYETGVRGLQRHDYPVAAQNFREVLQKYPAERELVERARLYLQVCERETSRQPSGPQTLAERVYAATVALNAGDSDTALAHLRKAIELDPESDHAHYIMAVALTDRGEPATALGHLRRAVHLNPDNRAVARQDPDLSDLRDVHGFDDALAASSVPMRRKPKARK